MYRYRRELELHIVPEIGAVRLQALTTGQVQVAYNNMLSGGLSTGTVQLIHTVFKKSLNQAVENGIIRTNPAKVRKLPKYERPAVKTLSGVNIRWLLNDLSILDHPESRYGDIIRVSPFTGIRKGDMLELSWDEINLQNRTIDIRQQLHAPTQAGQQPYIALSKGNKTRTICAPDIVMDIFRHQQAAQAKMRLATGELWQDTGLVFTRENGTGIRADTVLRAYKSAVAEICIHDTRFHALRHTTATMMLQNGNSPRTVQETFGHADVGFTMNVYGHVTEKMRRDSADRMDRLAREL